MIASPVLEAQAMARALRLADEATGRARPNPGVGCVLLRDGEVVGEGSSSRVGGPHAEVVALQQAGDRAGGATAIVTLEPCDHHGRTGPCSVALLEAGVARVVHAVRDPGRDAAGGADRLRAAGVEVVDGLLAPWAAEVHRAFLVSASQGRSAVTLKVAMTLDGAMALPGRRWITSPEARRRVHWLRGRCDGVLVGVGTVLADDPSLDVRHVDVATDQPRPVVLDRRLRTPPGAAVVGRGAVVVAGQDAPGDRRGALADAGAEVVTVPEQDGVLDLRAALTALADLGLRHLFAEPGPTLGAALLADGLVDDVVLHVAPDVAGDPSLPTVAPALAHPLALDVRRIRPLGVDLEIHLRPTG